MEKSRKIVYEREWDSFGKQLIYQTHHEEEYHQYRLINMWEDPNDNDDVPKVIFNEIKVSKELFEKFVKMTEEENQKDD